VPEFAAFCKTATKGQVGIVKTQFGFHIIKMMEEPQSKKIKYTQSVIELGASPGTVSLIDEKSRAFRNKVTADEGSFDKAIEKMALVPRVMKDVKTDN
jgi:parvulin-like peptidyl-prolyl isomerase